MKKVAGNQRLLRRNGTYYYRRRVPVHLVKAIGKKFIVLSLDTTSLKQAKQLRAVKDLEWDAQFGAAEAGHGPPAQSTLSERGAVMLIRDYVEGMNKNWKRASPAIPRKTSKSDGR